METENKATILVVDDEKSVQTIVRLILESFGFRVIEASSGREAVEIFKKSNSQIDLLITDVMMPQMNRYELAKELRIIAPDLKILFISGYIKDSSVERSVLQDNVDFLQKPFTSDTLIRQIRLILESQKEKRN